MSDASRSCRSSASTTPSSAWATTLDGGTRRALAEAMVTDVLHGAAPRRSAIDEVDRRDRASRAPSAIAARLRRRRRSDDRTSRPQRRGAGRRRWALERGASASCSCPATARRSTRASSTTLLARAGDERSGVVDRPRPPRHRHQRAAAHARRTRSRPASAPAAAQRHERARARPRRAPARGRARRRRWRSTSTRRGPRGAARRARRAHRRRRAHARACSTPRSRRAAEPPRGRAGAPGACPRSRRGDDLAALIAGAPPSAATRGCGPATCSSSPTRSSPRPRARVGALADVDAVGRARASSPPSTARTRATSRSSSTRRARSCAPSAGVLICRTHHGFVCANAGVDASNAPEDGALVLLPRDPDARRARALRCRAARRARRS